jgi:hypothetical protein
MIMWVRWISRKDVDTFTLGEEQCNIEKHRGQCKFGVQDDMVHTKPHTPDKRAWSRVELTSFYRTVRVFGLPAPVGSEPSFPILAQDSLPFPMGSISLGRIKTFTTSITRSS